VKRAVVAAGASSEKVPRSSATLGGAPALNEATAWPPTSSVAPSPRSSHTRAPGAVRSSYAPVSVAPASSGAQAVPPGWQRSAPGATAPAGASTARTTTGHAGASGGAGAR
jgi:hypothetical protein